MALLVWQSGAKCTMQRAAGAVQSTRSRVGRASPSRVRVVMRGTFGRASSRVRVVTRALFGGGGGSAQTTIPALEEIRLKDIDNKPIRAATYVGKVLLVTNVASNCGFTASNYKDLVELYDRFKGKDFEILAFPCNQFGGQEPGSNQQIKEFTKRYGVEFPVTEKVEVNGPNTHPFFTYLKEKGPRSFLGNDAKWNFEKFLVDKKGNVVKRYFSTTSPLDIAKDIEAIL
mmetsp:Transcript_315/g.831  ORF Transcript_315/g.831 Transcript_315/m.831 type:complete len:229 (-) Transcript_315:110-796(-)